MIQKGRKFAFLILAMMNATMLFANGEAVSVLSDNDFFKAVIANGSSTVDAFFTVTSATKKEVMIGYDNFYYDADVASPFIPNIGDNIVEGTFVTAIPKTTVGAITIPSTVIGTDGVTYKVTGIANHAFAECNSLTSVSIPSSITDIDTYAFNLCTGLTSLTVDINTPLPIGSSTFEGCYDATLYVPQGKVSAYQSAAYWKNFNTISEIGKTNPTGDVNLDGEVNIEDVITMISYILGKTPQTFAEEQADLDGDGEITISDVTALITIILKK